MRPGGKYIYANTIDEAAEKVLIRVLKEEAYATRSVSSRDNVFYFDGWHGLGASAVLRAIAQHLAAASPAGKGALGFDQVVHIDCSMWESRRALQRAAAEQLGLPDEVMALLDRQDEEDDFRGVPRGSRVEVQQVLREMQQHTQKLGHRFLVIFHNGSDEEINLESVCGFPLSGFSTNKVLWTFQGRFRLQPRAEIDTAMQRAGTTDAFISTSSDGREVPLEIWSYLVQIEASEVAEMCKINAGLRGGGIVQPAQVAECFLYLLGLCCRGHHSIDHGWATHGANYWICDGIMQQQQLQQGDREEVGNDGLWRAAEALQREVLLDAYYHQYLPSSHLARFVGIKPCWISPNYGFHEMPAAARAATTPNGDSFNKLRVLKLSRCTFNFRSPPFLCCHGLRFLWLDHCQDTGNNDTDDGARMMEEDARRRRCFQRLWVLDVRHTNCDQILSAQALDLMTQLRELVVMGARNWDMGQLHGRLPNIRKLRITNPIVSCRTCSENDLFSEMNKMELLDFSGNTTGSSMKTLSAGTGAISHTSCLETVIVDVGSFGLEYISFSGCTKLKNLFLRGLMGDLRTLDISGTAVKTTDLPTASFCFLNELYLLGCKNLCAITWPPKGEMKQEAGLSKLCIDTTQSAPSGTSEAAVLVHGSRPIVNGFPWYISVRDARLLTSLEPVCSDSRKIYVEVYSPTSPTNTIAAAAAGCKYDQGIESGGSSDQQQVLVSLQQRQTAPAMYTADHYSTTMNHLKQQASEIGDADMWMWPCPDVPDLPQESCCYMHIQDDEATTNIVLLLCRSLY